MNFNSPGLLNNIGQASSAVQSSMWPWYFICTVSLIYQVWVHC